MTRITYFFHVQANLSPTDNIRVYYQATQKLVKILEEFSDFIHSTVKQPLQEYPVPSTGEIIITKKLPIKNDDFEITITWGEGGKRQLGAGDASSKSGRSNLSPSSSSDLPVAPQAKNAPPACKYVNLVLCSGLKSAQGRTGKTATLLLENPSGVNGLSHTAFVEQIQSVFGIRGLGVQLYLDSALTQEVNGDAPVTALAGQMVYITYPVGRTEGSLTSNVGWPVCHYVNIEGKSKKGTLLLENPRGDVLSLEEVQAQAATVMGVPLKKLKLSQTKEKMSAVTDKELQSLSTLHGRTLYMM
ncbi:hypothetical protein EGW08_014131 [Elysia chlorotica]|uniref:Isoleucine--tRNA ligase cytoplasmic ubiquitin-like domain-containing protein n=1 Tax=Elysia chlorotica TaxID=188477 RepID=A0A3S0ZG57_ELYCH|nr:hypothetical protein EGW08_014131 [Elysia chlorotica]